MFSESLSLKIKTTMKKRLLLFIPIFLLIICSFNKSEKKITYIEFLNRLNTLENLALLPEKGEKSAMWSSYDRRSHYDTLSGKYINWYANGDGYNQRIRMEGKNEVLAEMTGPGAIVRIWTAQPDTGHIQIFIDGNEIPEIDLPFVKFFDGSVSPFNYTGLVYTAARGCNNFVPITYQKSCKIVAKPGWGLYYHFNYISLPEKTLLEPFKMNLNESSKAALQKVNDYFEKKLGQFPYPLNQNDKTIKKSIRIEPGSSVSLAEIDGQYAIKSFKVLPKFSDRSQEMIGLRKLLLTMNWDGEKQPSVWSPLGDFFGTTPAVNHYKTLPLGMTSKNFYSYWYMPFGKKAEINLRNLGSVAYEIDYEIIYGALSFPIDNYARFHAWWHGDILPLSEDRWPDWSLLTCTGSGRYIGTMLHVMNPDELSCKAAAGEGHPWWGEGDEKFFIDGEKFPSTYGTGSEDYFGYAWGNPAFFQKAYHSQSMTTENMDHQTISRWHISDNVSFQTSFEGSIEKYYSNECGTKYNAMVYWYLSAAGSHSMPQTEIPIDYVILAPTFEIPNNPCTADKTMDVTLKTNVGEIRYTLDGSEPTNQSILYTKPFKITKQTLIKAKCFAYGTESRTKNELCRFIEWKSPVSITNKLVNGLNYSYFETDSQWFSVPNYSKMTAKKTGNIDKVKLGIQEREDHWGLLFSGFIKIETKGVYDFFLNSDDGSQLYISDELIVDNDKTHGELEVSGRVALEIGYYPIRIAYFENGLYQVLQMKYLGPGIKKQEVPNSILFYTN